MLHNNQIKFDTAIKLEELGAAPAAVANTIHIYGKDISGVTELFARDSAGNEVQITQAGTLKAPASAYNALEDSTQYSRDVAGWVTIDSFAMELDSVYSTATTWKVAAALWRDGGSGNAELRVTIADQSAHSDQLTVSVSAGAEPNTSTSATLAITVNKNEKLDVTFELRYNGGAANKAYVTRRRLLAY